MPQSRSAGERLDLVRETVQGFQGARAESRTARRRGLSRGQNLLLGAALHAAARLEQGLEATELEKSLLEILRVAADDDTEIAAWGQVFADQRATRGGTGIFPDAINGLDVKSGYDFADLRADLIRVTPEIVAQPNVEIVEVNGLELDGPKDSDEFLEAMGRYGTGVSVFTGRPSEPAATDTGEAGATPAAAALPAPLKLTLRPSRFECEKRSGELGRDEIYWAMTVGTDTDSTYAVKTPEFGSIVAGSHREFPVIILENGPVRSYVSLNIECWEADDSSGGFYNALRDALSYMSKRLADASKNQNYTPPDREFDADGWAALLAIVGELINAILGWLTNDDDLVCERSIGLSHAALTRYFTGDREEWWKFDGGDDGRHKLWLRGKAQLLPRNVKFKSQINGAWSFTNQGLDTAGQVGTTAAGAAFNGVPSYFYTNSATHRLYWKPAANQAGQVIHQAVTKVPPGVAVHDGALYCMHVGLDNAVYWNKRTPSTDWTPHTPIPGWATTVSPALASHNGTLYCVLTAMDGSVRWSKFTGSSWTSTTVIGGWGTPRAAALTSHGSSLYLAHLGFEGRMWLSSSSNGSGWSQAQALSDWSSLEAPALGSADGKLYFAWRTVDGTLRVSTHNGSTWSAPTDLQTGGYGAPALITRPGSVQVLYVA
ncbi:hypothetical protein [Streptomyces sp. H39-S7]|uniref:hypothetical protein n=1 Tax=Streptomyces sp. H39-S7 TaxID=3004357 RepID=UPI0022AF46D0|nr:hypothetical protein [Streptomyces sp. H39-S7]MCZ4124155.1 hypothetical protein [Streptomyces sp. H39-S7]